MVFVADDLGAWLVAALADAARRRLTTWILGSDQERALRQAAAAAVELTALEIRPGGGEQADQVALVISQVFSEPIPDVPLAGQATVLEALQAGIRAQLAVLDDPDLTGTGQSAADVLGVPSTRLATKLTTQLLREIVVRGARGGPLTPLANQLNHDVTYLQGQRTEDMLAQLADEVREVLARLDSAPMVAAMSVVLAQLPPLIEGFIGRDSELAMLAGLLDPAAACLVVSVAGLAGAGKTTLAVRAGHAARERGWFGGGVLFIDLHGYDDLPVGPWQAFDALLRALRVPAERIPPSVEERAWLYRSVLAQIPDPVLLIADNASSEAQMRPLLPGTGRHKVMVTSRHTLAGLDARLVDVTVLGETASLVLLEEALRSARPGDDRISSDPNAAERLARMCGGLPLALRIAAALLKANPLLSAAELAEDLAVERDRLELLRYDDGSGPNAPSIAAAFGLSFRRLDDTSARMFRLLPFTPGPDVSTEAVAIMVDLPVGQVRGVLAGLARAHLVEAAPSGPSRWRMHDLLRIYAQRVSDEYADADGRQQSQERLLGYYLRAADAATDNLRRGPHQDDALAWLDEERASLVAAVSMAANSGLNQVAMRLPIVLVGYLDWRRRFDDILATTAISLNVSRRLGDKQQEGRALENLGYALRQVRRFVEAITVLQNAVAIYRETDDRPGEGMALNNLGIALLEVRRFEEAITACQDAAAIFAALGDRDREGIGLDRLGEALREAGRPGEAVTAYQNALAIYRDTGDRHREGMGLDHLGEALRKAGRPGEAVTAYQNALAIYRDTGDRHREGMGLDHLGEALRKAGRPGEAVTAHQDAAAIFRETSDRHSEAGAVNNLGLALREGRWFEEAITAHRDAAAIFRETDDRHSEGVALANLGIALQKVERFEEAITAHRDAAAIFRETDDRHSEGVALANLGIALQKVERFEEAITAHRDAAAIFRETDDRHSEGVALANLEAARAAQQQA